MARKWISSIALVATILVGLQVSSHEHTLCEGFLPENNLKIPANMFTGGGITQDEFNAVMERAERIYAPIMLAEGGVLKLNRLWTDATVNASATRSGNTWVLNMYGGLARHAATNFEGMALVVCHEIGHHIGGAPKIASWFSSWATNEGGSDYFATSKCLRKLFAEDDNKAIVASAQLDPTAQTLCGQQFTNEVDQLLCLRTSMAGQSVANLFQALRNDKVAPNYATPDAKVVKKTNDNHPDTQCRLDTYLAGFACQVDANSKLSNSDYREGTCYTPRDTSGVRPLCWFADK